MLLSTYLQLHSQKKSANSKANICTKKPKRTIKIAVNTADSMLHLLVAGKSSTYKLQLTISKISEFTFYFQMNKNIESQKFKLKRTSIVH